jgi:hypothetical protein
MGRLGRKVYKLTGPDRSGVRPGGPNDGGACLLDRAAASRLGREAAATGQLGSGAAGCVHQMGLLGHVAVAGPVYFFSFSFDNFLFQPF